MLAVVFLGLCASSILTCVTSTARRLRETEQREQVLTYLETQIEALASSSRKTPPAALNSTSSLTLTGISRQVTIDKVISLVPGTSDLYLVDLKATWYDTANMSDNQRVLRLTTYVRAPYG